jgi:hypothetical protein
LLFPAFAPAASVGLRLLEVREAPAPRAVLPPLREVALGLPAVVPALVWTL